MTKNDSPVAMGHPGPGPVYDKSVVARIATQMGWTPPDATTLRVLSSHAIRKHEGVTIFGDPAQVLKVMAAIEGAQAKGE
jgi:hypothetical protein